MQGVVEGKLRSSEEVHPVILVVVTKASKVKLQALVSMFSLFIRLRMKGSAQIEFDVEGLHEICPIFGRELWALIRYNIVWKSMKSEDIGQE